MLENNFEPDCKRLRFLLYTGRNIIQSQVGEGRYFVGIRNYITAVGANKNMIHFMFDHIIIQICEIFEFVNVR